MKVLPSHLPDLGGRFLEAVKRNHRCFPDLVRV